jgi:WAP-type (Whey Acidic Protein) 'four-disulfide core'
VRKCYDEVVYKVPAGALNNGRNRGGFSNMAVCADQCQRSSNCGPGEICCTNGCGNICYTPETTVVDLANTGMNNGFNGQGGWLNGGSGLGGVYGPYSGGPSG